MILFHSRAEQVLLENIHQEIRLAAPANAGHNFNHAVMHAFDEPIQMNVALYFHIENDVLMTISA